MSRGKHPRLITNREKILQMTGRKIPLTRISRSKKRYGVEYVIKPKPYCSKCKIPVMNLYKINAHWRREGLARTEHRAYECPKCGHLFSRKMVKKEIEEFNGDER